MRRITLWILSTLSALVLLFSYHTSTDVSTVAASSKSVSDSVPTTSSTPAGAAPPTTTAPPPTTTASTTFTGAAVDTRYGPVQVRITVTAGTITDATAVEYPTGNGRDQQINARAVPTLETETVTAQSADVDMVSGATYTSEGYTQSLQSAIDQANL